jgi:hypothetical protein
MALLQRINSSLKRNGSEWDTPVSPWMRSAGEDLRRQRQAFNLELEDAGAAAAGSAAALAADAGTATPTSAAERRRVNGKAAPVLGRPGTVRNVALDPQLLTAEASAHN